MQQARNVLIVDDELQMRRAMETVLARMGCVVFQASNGVEAMEVLASTKIELIISDMKMPEMTGEELLAKSRKQYANIPVVMITAYGTIGQAVEVMKAGAYDFITKPFSAEALEAVVDRIFKAPVAALRQAVKKVDRGSKAIVTNDPGFKKILQIASSVAPSSASVLIQGESGTGKELIASLIHNSSSRRSGPFVAVNCAALPGNLLESELFGHEKGSFTGATSMKPGKFELANGGTILLDEISEMEQVLQAKLLRVIQEREVDRVGGNKPIPIDVRIIATTNRDLRECVAKKEFREDLYYRLNVIPLYVPALRERKGDIRLLVEHFVRRFSDGQSAKVGESLMKSLEGYRWPGNIRELQNATERAVILSAGGKELQLEHFFLGSMNVKCSSSETSLQIKSGLSVAEAERRLIFETLRSTNNNKTKAAELLGISIRTLRNKLHEYSDNSLTHK